MIVLVDQAEEQEYFDRALDFRDRMRDTLAAAPDSTASPKDAIGFRKGVEGILEMPPDDQAAIGSFDANDGDRVYVGRATIWGNEIEDLLVVNWQRPVAEPFYLANPVEPGGVAAKREYLCIESTNTIEHIEEVIFAEIAARVTDLAEPEFKDALLADLERHRTGEMQDIVATIQKAQFEAIKSDLDQLLVVQGGPGTGKTAVGLHRVSWLLYNHAERLSADGVMVVGPNRAFIRYIGRVLPSLGDTKVVQRSIASVGPDVRVRGTDTAAAAHLKGDPRMVQVIDRALRRRQRIPDEPVTVRVRGRRVTLEPATIRERVAQLDGLPHNTVRDQLRERLLRDVAEQLRAAGTSADDVAGEAATELDNALDRIWPRLTPQAFLAEAFATARQLREASEGILNEAERDLLALPTDVRLRDVDWTDHDIALLDEADRLLNPPAPRFGHIVVDEAQDLSPMQLRAIARRSLTGSMTIVGDLAQATSAWAHDDWADVVTHLKGDAQENLIELDVGYRVPQQIFEFAARLLPEMAPTVTPPKAIRPGASDPDLCEVDADEVLIQTVDAAQSYAAHGNLVGVIVPDAIRAEVVAAFKDADTTVTDGRNEIGTSITVVPASLVKGLEFDSVVVVEPATIAAQAEHGLRLLYVALTRPTRHLTIVHAQPLPEALGTPETGAPQPPEEPPPDGRIDKAAQPTSDGANPPEDVVTPPPPLFDDAAITDAQRKVADAAVDALVDLAVTLAPPPLLPLIGQRFAERLTSTPDD